ncbi:RNA-binding protein L-like [Lolium rigidum]|uniref:RNA-binding protein L-like n=1 Tax=Lolium rigidum TaxID=89674 RepID=UPI001F5D1F52|nr:RNA-binding protein L-like [Lolium rigidum]
MAPSSSSNWAMAPPYHYHGPPPQKEQAAPAAEDETGAGSVGFGPRSLWIGGLLDWMDENYLYSCFTRSPELVSVVIKRNKETRQSEGYGFLNFADHVTADQILHSYNGQRMPNADRDFRLNWVMHTAPEKPASAKPAEDDHAIYVGGLAYDVTDFMLHNVFKNRYPSVTKATVIRDGFVGPSKGYGFVVFGDVNERRQAMTEMDGAYCSTRPMRIRAATGSRTQGTDSDGNWDNKRLFVRGLDLSVTAEDLKKAFSPYGEITNTMLIEGKCCGFITYTSRASAEEALRILDGSQLGDNTMRIFWARPPSNKKDEVNDEYHGHPQGLGPDNGYCPGDPNMHGYKGHGGNAYNQHKQPQQTPVQ